MNSTYPLKMSHFVQFYIQVVSLVWILQLFHSQLCEPFSEVLFNPKKLKGHGPITPYSYGKLTVLGGKGGRIE